MRVAALRLGRGVGDEGVERFLDAAQRQVQADVVVVQLVLDRRGTGIPGHQSGE